MSQILLFLLIVAANIVCMIYGYRKGVLDTMDDVLKMMDETIEELEKEPDESGTRVDENE